MQLQRSAENVQLTELETDHKYRLPKQYKAW